MKVLRSKGGNEEIKDKRVPQTGHTPRTGSGLVSGINDSPLMAAQRMKMQRLFGDAAQLEAAEEEPIQGMHAVSSPARLNEQISAPESLNSKQQAQGSLQPTSQMKEGDSANGEKSLGATFLNLAKNVDEKAEPRDEWFIANQVHGNMLFDAGHITGGIVKKIALLKYRDAVERKRMDELATEKLHLIEKNMYGRGKIGAVMRGLDTTSRIMHLIGSLAALVALAANIAAFFVPAALPVGAVAGVIALAAHSAMSVLQGILIGRNLYRIRGLPEAEKAKILPTLYRDITKLGFALLGVITGGVGLGGAMQGGGLMASHALEGAEVAAHGGHLAGDVMGEGIGTYAMMYHIAKQNWIEDDIGRAGGLDHHAKGHEAESPQDDLAQVMQSDIGESDRAVQNLSSASEDAVGGADGLKADVKPLDELSKAEPKAQQSLATLEAGDNAVDSIPEMKESELDAKSAQVDKAEDALGIPKSEEATEHEAGKEPVQRAGKPGLIDRMIGWFKRKFSSFKNRVKKVIRSIQAKLTEIVLKLAGVKNLPAQMNEALAEHRAEAKIVMGASMDGRKALAEWKSVADKIGEQKR